MEIKSTINNNLEPIYSGLIFRLKQDPQNAKSLQSIEEALFVLSLDRPNRAMSDLPSGKSVSAEVEDVSLSERQTMVGILMGDKLYHLYLKLLLFQYLQGCIANASWKYYQFWEPMVSPDIYMISQLCIFDTKFLCLGSTKQLASL